MHLLQQRCTILPTGQSAAAGVRAHDAYLSENIDLSRPNKTSIATNSRLSIAMHTTQL